MINTYENKYNGIIVDQTTLPQTINDFKREIIHLTGSLKGKKLLWVKIPIEKSDFIPVLTSLDFVFHHCDENTLWLLRKLAHDAVIPTTKNFIVGVGAIVFNQKKLLVIKDKWSDEYKLPGGHIDRYESIINALKREVYEETGIQIEFDSIMNIGHFRRGQFGESNLYIVCTAKALTKEITINDSLEITEAHWMDVEDFLNSDNVNVYNRSVVQAAVSNKDVKLTQQHIQLRVPGGEVFF